MGKRNYDFPVPDKIPLKTTDDDGSALDESYPIKNPSPSTADKLWANRLNLIRHFIIDGGTAALSAFTLTRDLAVAGGAFVLGGVIGAARKGNDDLRRAAGKPDMLTAAKNRITRTGGVDMSASDYTKADTIAFGQSIGRLVNGARNGVNTDDLGALIDAVTAGAQTVNEMKDVPAAAALHTIGAAADVVGDQFLADAVAAEVEPNA